MRIKSKRNNICIRFKNSIVYKKLILTKCRNQDKIISLLTKTKLCYIMYYVERGCLVWKEEMYWLL